MELNLQKQTVSVNETVYDGSVEQPLECDVLLPDYCPDIQKILRCEVTPSLLAASVNGDCPLTAWPRRIFIILTKTVVCATLNTKFLTRVLLNCAPRRRTQLSQSARASIILIAVQSVRAGSICAARSVLRCVYPGKARSRQSAPPAKADWNSARRQRKIHAFCRRLRVRLFCARRSSLAMESRLLPELSALTLRRS